MKKIFPILLASMILLSSCSIGLKSQITPPEATPKSEKDSLLEKINLIADKNRAIDKEKEQKNEEFFSRLRGSQDIIIDSDFPGSRVFFESNPLLRLSGSIEFHEGFIGIHMQRLPIDLPSGNNQQFWEGQVNRYNFPKLNDALALYITGGTTLYAGFITSEEWERMDIFQKTAALGPLIPQSDLIQYAGNTIQIAKEQVGITVECTIPDYKKIELINYLRESTSPWSMRWSDNPIDKKCEFLKHSFGNIGIFDKYNLSN